MAEMMFGRIKAALKHSIRKLEGSQQGAQFAFYFLVTPGNDVLLFVDRKPGLSPKRFHTPSLIHRHLQKSRLCPDGLDVEDMRKLRACAGLATWSGEGINFQVTARGGGARPAELKKALGKAPLNKLVKQYTVGKPARDNPEPLPRTSPGVISQQASARRKHWDTRDEAWRKIWTDAKKRCESSFQFFSLQDQVLLNESIQELEEDLEALQADLDAFSKPCFSTGDTAVRGARDRLTTICENFSRNLSDFSRWLDAGASARADILKRPLSPQGLKAQYGELVEEEVFELEQGERLEAESEEMMLALRLSPPPKSRDVSALGCALLRSNTSGNKEIFKRLVEAASGPLKSQLALMEEDHRKSLDGDGPAISSQKLCAEFLQTVQAKTLEPKRRELAIKLFFLFRGGSPAAAASGRMAALKKRGAEKAEIAQLVQTYQYILDEWEDFEAGVRLLRRAGMLDDETRVLRQYAEELGVLWVMVNKLLGVRFRVKNTTKCWPKPDNAPEVPQEDVVRDEDDGEDLIDAVVELHEQATELYDQATTLAEFLQDPEIKKVIELGGTYTFLDVETSLGTADVTVKDTSLSASLDLDIKGYAKAEARGTFTFKNGRLELEGEAEIGAMIEAKAKGHAELSYKGSQLFSMDVTMTANAGVGAKGSGSFRYENGKLYVRLSGSFSAGVGVGIEPEVSVDFVALFKAMIEVEFYKQLAKVLEQTFTQLYQKGVQVTRDHVKWKMKRGGSTGNFPKGPGLREAS